jgi:hypothetical protein
MALLFFERYYWPHKYHFVIEGRYTVKQFQSRPGQVLRVPGV